MATARVPSPFRSAPVVTSGGGHAVKFPRGVNHCFLLRRALCADLVDGTAMEKREAIVLILATAALLLGYLT